MTFNPQVGDNVRIINFNEHEPQYSAAGYVISGTYKLTSVFTDSTFPYALLSPAGRELCFPLFSLAPASAIRRF